MTLLHQLLILLIKILLVPKLLLSIECDPCILLIIFTLLHLLSNIFDVIVIYLLAISRPLVYVLNMIANLCLLLHCRVVPTALLLMLRPFLQDFIDILRSFVSEGVSLDGILGPAILEPLRW